jgi:fatty acid desaturase
MCKIMAILTDMTATDAPTAPAPTMLPAPSLLPDVLPTERLTASGKPVPEIRTELRRIDDLRNVGSVLLTLAQPVVTIGAAIWLDNPVAWVAAFLLMGPVHARFAILAHEAAHKLLFTNKRWNDVVGRWLLAYPALVPFDAYRRSHFAHHREEFGPNEPDMNLYVGYPITRASFRRKLRRDALGASGWKNLRALLGALRSRTARPFALRIVAGQLLVLVPLALIGRPELYVFLWLAPWLTVWRVLNRLRAIAEHGGMTASRDRRLTTHHVRQTWPARFVLVPFNTGWHLAHHVDMGVPWRNLPRLHAELVAAGWVVAGLEYPSYRALWRALRSRPVDMLPAALATEQ